MGIERAKKRKSDREWEIYLVEGERERIEREIFIVTVKGCKLAESLAPGLYKF